MKQVTVVSVCGDPGGAAAIGPVLRALAASGTMKAVNFGYGNALGGLGPVGVPLRGIPDCADDEWPRSTLCELRASALLVATSLNGIDYEKRMIAAAREIQVPSVAVLDFWSNYRERFADHNGRLAFAPDFVTAMDGEAREELIAAGLSPASIVVTGQPAFDELSAIKARFSPSERERLRTSVGTPRGGVQVLFVSQPLRLFHRETGAWGEFRRFDERSVRDVLIAALERAARATGATINLLIRPHPREEADVHGSCPSDLIRICVSRLADPRAAVMASDLIVGINSVLLVEACHLGCPVVSVRQSLGAQGLPAYLKGVAATASQPRVLTEVVERLVTDIDARISLAQRTRTLASLPPATPRVLECLRSAIFRHSASRVGI